VGTVSRQEAKQLIKRLRKKKRPKVYCVVRCRNTSLGADCYSICYSSRDYSGLLGSLFAGNIKVMWESKQFKEDHPGLLDNFEGWLISQIG
jgi:hypothetical protein